MNLVTFWGGGVGLPETVALAAVAVIGYLFGRRRPGAEQDTDTPGEVLEAAQIARRLESVAAQLRGDLATHLGEVERFKRSVEEAGPDPDEAVWQSLRADADRVLDPTLRLVSQIAGAYDQIRQQSSALADFSGDRIDPATGLCNRQGLRELLQIELSGHAATGSEFSIVVVGLHEGETPESREPRQARLAHAAELLRPQLRQQDRIARYGLDELVIVLPHTRLYGACVFGRRVRATLWEAGVTASCGVGQSAPGDEAQTLLGRADSALYSAKATGRGAQYLHNGFTIRADEPRPEPAEIDAAPKPNALELAAV